MCKDRENQREKTLDFTLRLVCFYKRHFTQ